MSQSALKYLRPLFGRRPLVAWLVVAVLALGLGTTIAVFAVAEAVFVRALPIAEADRLLYLTSKRLETGGLYGVRLHDALEWRQAPSLESLSVMRRGTVHLRTAEGIERLASVAVEPNYFVTLGVQPLLGRALLDSTQEPGAENIAWISHRLWQSRFGGRESILGESINLNGIPHLVLGVMPPSEEASILGWRDIWTPLQIDESEARSKEMWGFAALARLRDGADLQAARRELEGIAGRIAADRPEWNEGWGVETRPVREFMAADLEEPLHLVQIAALLVLLIACLTAGNLLFALTTERRREMALRRALGARATRLVGQLMGESGLLVALAAVLGAATAYFVGRLVIQALPADLLDLASFSIGPRASSLALVATLFTILLCGSLSALALIGSGTRHSLRTSSRNASRTSARLRAGLVGAESALAMVAIAGTLFLLVSLHHVQNVAPGFDAENLLTLRLELPAENFAEKETRRQAYENLLTEIAALPGVRSAAMAGFGLPLTGQVGVFQVWVEGLPKGPQPDEIVHAQVVSQDYFSTLGIERLEGRDFAAGETWESHFSIIVNETFANRYFPDQGALGRWVEFGNGEKGTIIGTVADVHQLALDRESQAEIYLAWGSTPATQSLIVSASGPVLGIAEAVRAKTRELLPGAPLFDPRSGEEILRSSYRTREITAWTLTAFAGMAQVLGLVGLYGLVLHLVNSRRRDLGIRVAVGARPIDLVRWALRAGLSPVVLGVALGSVAAYAVGRGLESQLFGVEGGDPGILALAAALTLLTALATALWPARGAARVDPATALRAE